MLKVLDILNVGNKLSITVEGKCEMLKNGSRLTDLNGNYYDVISVGMTRHDNPDDFSKKTNILVEPCNLKIGEELNIA